MLFSVQAVDSKGKDIHLSIGAASEILAATKVRGAGYFPVKIRECVELRNTGIGDGLVTKQDKQLSQAEKSPAPGAPALTAEADCPIRTAEHHPEVFALFLSLAFVVGVPLLCVIALLPSAQDRLEYRMKSNSSISVSEYAEGPYWSTSSRVNQRILDEYHRQGRFTGYTDGDELIRDLHTLKEAEKEVSGRGY